MRKAGSALTGWTKHFLLAPQAFHPTSCSQHAIAPSVKFFFSPYSKGTAHELMFQIGQWLQILFEYNRVDRDTEVDLGFLLCVNGCASVYGHQRRHFKGITKNSSQTCCDLHWKFFGKVVNRKSKHLFCCLHRRWTILSEWQYFANGWPEGVLLKWKILWWDLLQHAEEQSILADSSQSSLLSFHRHQKRYERELKISRISPMGQSISVTLCATHKWKKMFRG